MAGMLVVGFCTGSSERQAQRSGSVVFIGQYDLLPCSDLSNADDQRNGASAGIIT
jgi:hypothetical protein